MTEQRPLAIIDLDGVVADVRHRLHHLQGRRKDWTAFFAAAHHDVPHPEGLAVVETLSEDHEIVFLTGRPERWRAETEQWLRQHGLAGRVVMRPEGDRRPAAVVKVELLTEVAADRAVGVVVDDDPIVLEAMRRAGHPTFTADWERRAPEADQAIHSAQEVDGRT